MALTWHTLSGGAAVNFFEPVRYGQKLSLDGSCTRVGIRVRVRVMTACIVTASQSRLGLGLGLGSG